MRRSFARSIKVRVILLVFEDGFSRWQRTRDSRSLLAGRELRDVLENRSQILEGHNVVARTEYLNASLRRRNLGRGVTVAVVLASIGVAYLANGLWKDSVDRQALSSAGMQPELVTEQELVDSIDLEARSLNNLSWLHSDKRLKRLAVHFTGLALGDISKHRAKESLSTTQI